MTAKAELPRMSAVRWGIIGTGRISRTHILPAIRRRGAGIVTACASGSLHSAQSAAAEFAIPRVHTNWSQLVEDESIDAIYVATPNTMHADIVIAAAARGKHVLCEKPMALDYRTAARMVAACTSAGVVLRMGLQIRFEAVLQRAAEFIRDGALGEIRLVSIERMAPLQQSGAWREDRRQGGSVLFDVGVHLLDLVPWLLGSRIESVSSLAHCGGNGKPETTLTVLARMSDGAQAVMRCSRELPYANNDLTVIGTKGSLRTGPLRWLSEHTLQVVSTTGTFEEKLAATDLYGEEVTGFVNDVRFDSKSLADGDDGLRLVATTEAVEASLRSGGTALVSPASNAAPKPLAGSQPGQPSEK